jgi:uncharacterized protein (DUF1697 family)
MPRYAALLRGVSPMNLKMADLKSCLENLGFTNVVTVLSSGNVMFDSRASSASALEAKIEKGMAKHLDRTFYTIVRPVEDLVSIIEEDLFKEFGLKASHKKVVTFMREKPKAKLKLPIELDQATILKVKGTEIYSAYIPGPKGPVFMNLIEKTFGKDITTRTLDTVRKLTKK